MTLNYAQLIDGISLSVDPSAPADSVTLDSSGRLLVGTSSAPTAATTLVLKGNSGSTLTQGRIHIQREVAPGPGEFLGDINFMDTSDGRAGLIGVARDGGTWIAGSSTPGRLVFNTTADGASSPTERMRINSNGLMSGQAQYIERVFNLLYARLATTGSCNIHGPSCTFTNFDSSEPAFITVSRTTTTATSGYRFIGDGNGRAFTIFLGCGGNPVFVHASKDGDGPEYHSWVLVDEQFVSALGGAPTNATRANLPTTP